MCSPVFLCIRVALFRSLFRLERCSRRLGFCGRALGTGGCYRSVCCECGHVVPSSCLAVRGLKAEAAGDPLHMGNRGPSHSAAAVMPISSSCFASPCFVDHLYLDATVVMSSRGRANHGSTQWSGAMEQ